MEDSCVNYEQFTNNFITHINEYKSFHLVAL